jgi:hypothetical protein
MGNDYDFEADSFKSLEHMVTLPLEMNLKGNLINLVLVWTLLRE